MSAEGENTGRATEQLATYIQPHLVKELVINVNQSSVVAVKKLLSTLVNLRTLLIFPELLDLYEEPPKRSILASILPAIKARHLDDLAIRCDNLGRHDLIYLPKYIRASRRYLG